MPRKLFCLPAVAVLAMLLVMAACGGSDDSGSGEAVERELPDTTSASVIAYLDEVDYQNNDDWRLFPGSTERYAGTDPHGMLLTTYVNSAAFNAIEAGETTPSGSILVKENYSPEGNLGAITVMYKVSGYNPDHDDWYWLKELADGTVEKEGMVMGCQECHQDVSDYIFGPQPQG